MGSNLNFQNLGNGLPGEGDGGGRLPFSFPLTRQPSIYSLTFDEFQSTMGALGKDFGSMNMDELLKNIWSAEENQNIASISGGGGGGGQEGGGCLQRQGSLTIPRTLSLKTVDEVWQDMSKEFGGGTDTSCVSGGFFMSQRQPTLGEITLEEFLVRAGVVREETQVAGKSITVGYLDNLPGSSNNWDFGFGNQQANGHGGLINGRIAESSNQIANGHGGLINGSIAESSNQIAMQSANLPLNVNGVRSSAHQSVSQQQSVQSTQQQQLLPKQPALAYAAPIGVPNNGQLSSPEIRGGIVGITDSTMNSTIVQNTALQGGGLGLLGLGANGVGVATGSPAVSSDGLIKGNGDTSSLSPVPYVFNGGLRGRKITAIEKVVERRHRRMIKNRESAARSRARKQAYTMELEAEVAKLKEENQELQKKEAELMETQKNQVLETMNQQKNGTKRRCLRRTHTGPW